MRRVVKGSSWRRLAMMWMAGMLATGFFAYVQPQTAFAAVQATFYVDPTAGSDSNNGLSSGAAWQTIAKARDYIRANYATQTGDILVYLMGGTYTQTSTLAFDSSDSGKNGYSIKYVNYSGQIPIVSGGTAITSSWTLYDSGANIYKTTVGSLDFRQLYINDAPAIRARTPNGNTKNTLVAFDTTNKKIKINKSQIAAWNNPTDVEFNNYMGWTNDKLRLSSYTTDAAYAYLKFQNPEADKYFYWTNAWLGIGMPAANQYYWENAYEFIDAEGEWYLDKSTSPYTLYYKPRTGENMTNGSVSVVVPTLETVVSVQGTLDDPVKNLVFYGIHFRHATWMNTTANGYVGYQFFQYLQGANIGDVNRPPGGVSVAAAHDITFERNTFELMGAVGLDVEYGTENTRIVGNVFKHIAGSGLQLARFQPSVSAPHGGYNPTDTRDLNVNDLVGNNYFVDTAREYQGAVPLAVGYGVGTVIEHNQIEGAPFDGIHIGGHATDASNAMKQMIVRGNEVANAMQELNDGGGIYTKGSSTDYGVLYENYLHMDTASTNPGANYIGMLYHDTGSGYYLSARNVLDNVYDYADYTYKFNNNNSPFKVLVDVNYVTDTLTSNSNPSKIELRNSLLYATANWPQAALDIIARAGLTSVYDDIVSGGAAPDYTAPVAPASPPGGFIPTANLGLWLKADAGVTKNGSDRVSRWADYSGSGADAEVLDSSAMPLWVANALNGKPALRFDGTQSLIAHDFVDIDMRDFTMTFVLKPAVLVDYNQAIGSAGGWGEAAFRASANGTLYAGPDGDSRIVTTSGQIQSGVTQIFTYKYSGGSAWLYRNGALIGSASGLETGYPTPGFAMNPNGDVPEVVVYKSALSDTDRGTVETYLRDKYARVNIAQGKTATASSDAGASYVASKALDGDYGTTWIASGSSMPQTLTVDLGSVYSLTGSRQTFTDVSGTYNFKLEGSLDGATGWTMLADHTGAAVSGPTVTDSFSGLYRYVRMTVTGASGGQWGSSDEFEIYGMPNVAFGKTVTVSTNAGASYVGSKAVDGDPATRWIASNGTMPQTLTVNLGVPYALSAIKQTFTDVSGTYNYKLEGSPNGTTGWVMLADHTTTAVTGPAITDFVSGTYKYVRMTVTGASGGQWGSSREFEVYGE
ncbi:MAG: discoidin domain-containing protein [Paenibacillaceae bacterium]|nr:discoidin domain-containing protein [Paenibacillaceae bacterium]